AQPVGLTRLLCGRFEDHQAARPFATAHGGEPLVDLVEREPLSDEGVEVEAAVEVHLDVAGGVDLEAVGSHDRTLDSLPARQIVDRYVERGTGGDESHDRRRTAALQHREGSPSGGEGADR